MLERESALERVCKVLKSEVGGTERVGSAIEGQSPLPSKLRQIRGNEMIERSNPLSKYETCWEAS